jgi:hypothetical protein
MQLWARWPDGVWGYEARSQAGLGGHLASAPPPRATAPPPPPPPPRPRPPARPRPAAPPPPPPLGQQERTSATSSRGWVHLKVLPLSIQNAGLRSTLAPIGPLPEVVALCALCPLHPHPPQASGGWGAVSGRGPGRVGCVDEKASRAQSPL